MRLRLLESSIASRFKVSPKFRLMQLSTFATVSAMSGRCRQTDARARGPSAIACSAAIPGRPDRRPRPARAEAAAIVATTVKARPAEIVPVAIVPVITWGWIDIPRAAVAARHGSLAKRPHCVTSGPSTRENWLLAWSKSHVVQIASGIIWMAPQGHSWAQTPQPLQ